MGKADTMPQKFFDYVTIELMSSGWVMHALQDADRKIEAGYKFVGLVPIEEKNQQVMIFALPEALPGLGSRNLTIFSSGRMPDLSGMDVEKLLKGMRA